MFKILQIRLQAYVNWELPDVQAGFRKVRETRHQTANICWINWKNKRVLKKNLPLLYWLNQSFWPCRSQQTVENSSKDVNTRPPYLYPEKSVCNQEATVRNGHGTTYWFQIEKEYVKAVYCHPAYLTSMQSTSWETLGWIKHKLESRFPGEMSINWNMQMTHHPYGRKWRWTKSLKIMK